MKVHLNNDIERTAILDEFYIEGDTLLFSVNGKKVEHSFQRVAKNVFRIFDNKKSQLCYFFKNKNFTEVFIEGNYFKIETSKLGNFKEVADEDSKSLEYFSPMPGKISKIEVKVGSNVKKGDVLLYLEAMKMEHPIKSKIDGAVDVIDVGVGIQVTQGQKLIKLKNI